MIKPLAQSRRVFAIDIPGMGLSSRPDFDLKDPESTLEYLLSWLESWRETLKLEKIILMGHSFGGYLAAAYALKYSERVELLHLLSPIGITERNGE